MKCTTCRKDEREAFKQRLREEERLQNAYYTEMQEKMFAQARIEMEKNIASGAYTAGYCQTDGSSGMYVDETAR